MSAIDWFWVGLFVTLYYLLGSLWALLSDSDKPEDQQDSWAALTHALFAAKQQENDATMWVWLCMVWTFWPVGRYVLWFLWAGCRILKIKGY